MSHDKPLILIVDDEPFIRLTATDVLEEKGYSVAEAENAQSALKVLEARDDVQVLFTDIQMPGAFDGMELARRVHARWPHIQLILTSGRDNPSRAEIPDDGRFIRKPYALTDLVGTVNEVLHKA